MTPAQALSLTRYQINETTANFWTDAEIYAYMWEAENQLASIVGYEQAVTAHTTITDTSVYTVPDDTLRINRVTYDGRALKRVEARDIDLLNGTSYGSTVQAGKPEVYRQIDTNITVYPTPEEAKELYFEFTKAPAQITTDSTAFSIPNPAVQQLIPDYCVMRCMLKDTEKELVPVYMAKWQDSMNKAWSIKANEDVDLIQGVRDEDLYADGLTGSDYWSDFNG